ncbi:hypothetical protein, partial [Kitasatospora phosalacinea]
MIGKVLNSLDRASGQLESLYLPYAILLPDIGACRHPFRERKGWGLPVPPSTPTRRVLAAALG